MMERLTDGKTKLLKEEKKPIMLHTVVSKLAEYEDLEDKLNGISVKQVVDGFINTVENQTNEEYEHGRILTNADADKWNEYKQLEEQGLLLRLPCKVGLTVYHIANKRILEVENVDVFFLCLCVAECRFGKTVFLTQAEAEQKLKKMESDNNGTME